MNSSSVLPSLLLDFPNEKCLEIRTCKVNGEVHMMLLYDGASRGDCVQIHTQNCVQHLLMHSLSASGQIYGPEGRKHSKIISWKSEKIVDGGTVKHYILVTGKYNKLHTIPHFHPKN